MRVLFSSEEVRDVCTIAQVARRKFGVEGERKLRRRVNEIRSARDVRDIFEGPGRWHQLKGDRQGEVAADVTGSVRIIVRFDEATTALVVSVGNEYH